MRKLSWIDKLIFIANSLFATFLLLSNLLPFLSPKKFPSVAIFSLVVPVLIIINGLFVIYWLVKLKKQFLLSTLVLIVGFQQVSSFYKFSQNKILLTGDLKVMSYNVRLFDIYNWKEKGKDETIKIVSKFVKEKDPDIICFQEFLTESKSNFDYEFKYIQKYINSSSSNFGLAIYSKYKIVNKGSLDFEQTSNNTIFVDVVKGLDTIRVYNVHLESQHLQLDKDNLGEKNSERMIQRFKHTFEKQVSQVEKIVAHEKTSKHKTILIGDFNNTAFSWAYRQLKNDKNDAFVDAGKGFGKSYDYFFPARIDFILTDEQFEINNYKTYPVPYSDHFPIMSRMRIK